MISYRIRLDLIDTSSVDLKSSRRVLHRMRAAFSYTLLALALAISMSLFLRNFRTPTPGPVSGLFSLKVYT